MYVYTHRFVRAYIHKYIQISYMSALCRQLRGGTQHPKCPECQNEAVKNSSPQTHTPTPTPSKATDSRTEGIIYVYNITYNTWDRSARLAVTWCRLWVQILLQLGQKAGSPQHICIERECVYTLSTRAHISLPLSPSMYTSIPMNT